jgi:hypothetical protein
MEILTVNKTTDVQLDSNNMKNRIAQVKFVPIIITHLYV